MSFNVLRVFVRSRVTGASLRSKFKAPLSLTNVVKCTLVCSGTLTVLKYTSSLTIHCNTPSRDQLAPYTATAGTTWLQRVTTYCRIMYLMLLFTPALILHLIHFIIPFDVVRALKWYSILFAIQWAGPAFIKLGQWASTRRDIFPEDVCDCLSHLQRHCIAHSWQSTCDSLGASLGADWESMFSSIDKSPIGSGCIAQVYKWELKTEYAPDIVSASKAGMDSVPVAVKVLHPGIVESVLRDVSLMNLAANFIDYVFPDVYWISLRECVNEFGIIMKKQLDLQVEAESMDKFRENFSSHKYVQVPLPIQPYITRLVLIETFEEGIHISELLNKEKTSLHKQVASLGIDTILHMLFIHNFVHCDMHPGNLLVNFPSSNNDSTPSLILLDCGVTSSLSQKDWTNLHEVFLAIIKGEGNVVADLMLKNAEFSDCQDVDTYRKEIRCLIAKATEQLNLQNVDVGQLLSSLFRTLVRHKVKLESNFASVMLAIMVVEGIGRSLDPELDILIAARPFLLKKAAKKLLSHN